MLTLHVPNLVAEDTSKSLEYQIKAGFTCKFTKFVNWPTSVFPEKKTPFAIGILGQDPFGPVIDEAIKNLRIKKRKFEIKRFTQVKNLDYCHILFISRSEEARLEKILAQLHKTPTLTISEMDKFCDKGGIINFFITENKIRFQVSVKAARAASLELSTPLLRIANVVDSD